MEEKILGLYACGMSRRSISEQVKSLYDVDISPELASKISEKIMPEVTAWQNRRLEAVYPRSQVQRCIVHDILDMFAVKLAETLPDSISFPGVPSVKHIITPLSVNGRADDIWKTFERMVDALLHMRQQRIHIPNQVVPHPVGKRQACSENLRTLFAIIPTL